MSTVILPLVAGANLMDAAERSKFNRWCRMECIGRRALFTPSNRPLHVGNAEKALH
jgi:hypothetical protein